MRYWLLMITIIWLLIKAQHYSTNDSCVAVSGGKCLDILIRLKLESVAVGVMCFFHPILQVSTKMLQNLITFEDKCCAPGLSQ